MKWYSAIHTPGDSCLRVGVDQTMTCYYRIFQLTGGDLQDDRFVWRERADSLIHTWCVKLNIDLMQTDVICFENSVILDILLF